MENNCKPKHITTNKRTDHSIFLNFRKITGKMTWNYKRSPYRMTSHKSNIVNRSH